MLSALLVTLAILAPAHGATVATATPVVSGTAQPGAVVEVEVNGSVQGTVTADEGGEWSLTVTLDKVGANAILAASGGEATQHVVTFRPPTSAPDVRPDPARTPAPAPASAGAAAPAPAGAPTPTPTTIAVTLNKTLDLPRTLAPGTYTFVVRDTSKTRAVRFDGRTTGTRFTGVRRWTVTLTPGRYRWTVTPTGTRTTLTVR
jgi:hypothetical protein